MKKCITAIILSLLVSEVSFAVDNITWWGLVAFRQRHEVYKEYIDITASDSTLWGTLDFTDENSKTRLGYKFGVIVDVSEHIAGAITLRSGVGEVMWQDINSENTGLSPGLLEAYIDWKPPYGQALLGRFPQQGNAMWDIYAATLNIRWPLRQDNPTDGIFSDKMGALNGLKILVPVGPVTLRGIYHFDYVSGRKRTHEGTDNPPAKGPRLDQYTYLGGLSFDIAEVLPHSGRYSPGGFGIDVDFEVDFDYGSPHRTRRISDTDSDSTYADEELWGTTENIGVFFDRIRSGVDARFSYGYNWRKEIYKSRYWDYTASIEVYGFRLTGRYQYNSQVMQFGSYMGHTAIRNATHYYLNYTLWGLDIQPRYIKFDTEIAGKKATSTDRYELTTTVRF